MLRRLDFEKTQAAEQANAEAQSQVHSEVSRILSEERAMVQENLQQALVRERITTEDEKLRAQIYVSWCSAASVNFPVLNTSNIQLVQIYTAPALSHRRTGVNLFAAIDRSCLVKGQMSEIWVCECRVWQ